MSISVSEQSVKSLYREHGFLIVRGLFSQDELTALRAESHTLLERAELIDTQNIRCRWQDHVESGECLFDCFDPVIDVGPVCRYFAYHESLSKLLAEVYEEEACLFKDKLIFKRPGAKGYALHQDFIGWDSFPESFLTVVIPIDETNRSHGATEVFPGVSAKGCLSPRDGNYHELPLETINESEGVCWRWRCTDGSDASWSNPRCGVDYKAALRRPSNQ